MTFLFSRAIYPTIHPTQIHLPSSHLPGTAEDYTGRSFVVRSILVCFFRLSRSIAFSPSKRDGRARNRIHFHEIGRAQSREGAPAFPLLLFSRPLLHRASCVHICIYIRIYVNRRPASVGGPPTEAERFFPLRAFDVIPGLRNVSKMDILLLPCGIYRSSRAPR